MEEEFGMFNPYTDFNVSSMMGIYIYQYKGNSQKVTKTGTWDTQ